MPRPINAGYCKTICHRFKITRLVGESPYILGLKYCCRCACHFKQEGNRCPCCNQLMRVNAHNYRGIKRVVKRY